MKLLVFIAAATFLLPSRVASQDLSGNWYGKITQGPGGYAGEYAFELQIEQSNEKLSGVSFAYYKEDVVARFNYYGFFEGRDQIVLQEGLVLEEKTPPQWVVCIKRMALTYRMADSVEYLEGEWAGVGITDGEACVPGRVYLSKTPHIPQMLPENLRPPLPDSMLATVPDSASLASGPSAGNPAEPEGPRADTADAALSNIKPPQSIKDEANSKTTGEESSTTVAENKVAGAAPERNHAETGKDTSPGGRSLKEGNQVTVRSPDIVVKIVDYQILDGDTVTVYFNDEKVVDKKLITKQPIVLHLRITNAKQPAKLLLYADNLGRIPPNTALMVVEDREGRQRIKLESDYQRSDVLYIRYDP